MQTRHCRDASKPSELVASLELGKSELVPPTRSSHGPDPATDALSVAAFAPKPRTTKEMCFPLKTISTWAPSLKRFGSGGMVERSSSPSTKTPPALATISMSPPALRRSSQCCPFSSLPRKTRSAWLDEPIEKGKLRIGIPPATSGSWNSSSQRATPETFRAVSGAAPSSFCLRAHRGMGLPLLTLMAVSRCA